MFRHSIQSIFIRIAESFAIASLGAVCFFAQAASPQSSDTIAQAKQHYQNGVAAIAKNDWHVARNEFLQVAKLTPANAVAHYNLALAYSHTGQVKSAQAELSKAFQLGLPAEQKQAAEQLREQLAASAKNTTQIDSHNGIDKPKLVEEITNTQPDGQIVHVLKLFFPESDIGLTFDCWGCGSEHPYFQPRMGLATGNAPGAWPDGLEATFVLDGQRIAVPKHNGQYMILVPPYFVEDLSRASRIEATIGGYQFGRHQFQFQAEHKVALAHFVESIAPQTSIRQAYDYSAVNRLSAEQAFTYFADYMKGAPRRSFNISWQDAKTLNLAERCNNKTRGTNCFNFVVDLTTIDTNGGCIPIGSACIRQTVLDVNTGDSDARYKPTIQDVLINAEGANGGVSPALYCSWRYLWYKTVWYTQ